MAAAEIPRRDIRFQNLRNNMNLLLVLDCLRAGLSSWWIFSVLDFLNHDPKNAQADPRRLSPELAEHKQNTSKNLVRLA